MEKKQPIFFKCEECDPSSPCVVVSYARKPEDQSEPRNCPYDSNQETCFERINNAHISIEPKE